MKKSTIIAVIITGLFSLSNAQQPTGVGINTETPKATLHIEGNTSATGNSKVDGILIPKISRDQLTGKDGLYNAAQNGTLIFVETINGTTSTKTAGVTSTGFYYYDSGNSTWKSVISEGGGENDDGDFMPNPIEIPVPPDKIVAWGSHIDAGYNYFEFTNITGEHTVIRFPGEPDLANKFTNKTIYISNNTSYTLGFRNPVNESLPIPGLGSLAFLDPYSVIQLYYDGIRWYLMSGRQ
ncbi:MAG: hypothetical protein LBQ84_07990 [Flavobacteriaceae bacterium]|jgi:hypothetical protein|nr:hypothetical protein [Flavobacteriaceae bacterium]